MERAELPSNPLAITPNLRKLRMLADEFGFVLVVDDTIGSFYNIDLLGVADVVVPSLTKAFSGYTDVMGASVCLSPSSTMYPKLKQIFSESYSNDYFEGDAAVLEIISRDYLSRRAIRNNNAARQVEYLNAKVADPKSCVRRVYYPTTESSLSNYQKRMRDSGVYASIRQPLQRGTQHQGTRDCLVRQPQTCIKARTLEHR